MSLRILLLALTLLLTPPTLARPEGWSPTLSPRSDLPDVLMAVDMSRQRCFLVRNADKKLKKISMACTTGMRNGGKLVEGDRKTPEGVYFLEGRITSGLDFDSFGNTAYPMNYPNPADRVLGKTGDGIMIHGRGRTFGPRQTLGCVVLENRDVDSLHRYVRPHETPIIIAENIVWGEARRYGPPPEIVMGTWGWAKSRERREHAFFEIYDPKRFEISSGQEFESFKKRTLRTFSRRKWVDIRLKDIQVFEGPGYMVSTFVQRTMPDGEEGRRRLYWMRHLELWKIVGEEWIPGRVGKPIKYNALVQREIAERLVECAKAWDDRNMKVLRRAYDPTGNRNGEHGRKAIADKLAAEIDTGMANPFRGTPSVRITGQGIEATLQSNKRPARTFLFLPGAFDTWLIVREDG